MKKSRLTALFVAFFMVLSLFPMGAAASEEPAAEAEVPAEEITAEELSEQPAEEPAEEPVEEPAEESAEESAEDPYLTGEELEELLLTSESVEIPALDGGTVSVSAQLSKCTVEGASFTVSVPSRAAGAESEGFYVLYRESGQSQWRVMSGREIGGEFCTDINGLTPGTTYQYRGAYGAYINGCWSFTRQTTVKTFTTKELSAVPSLKPGVQTECRDEFEFVFVAESDGDYRLSCGENVDVAIQRLPNVIGNNEPFALTLQAGDVLYITGSCDAGEGSWVKMESHTGFVAEAALSVGEVTRNGTVVTVPVTYSLPMGKVGNIYIGEPDYYSNLVYFSVYEEVSNAAADMTLAHMFPGFTYELSVGMMEWVYLEDPDWGLYSDVNELVKAIPLTLEIPETVSVPAVSEGSNTLTDYESGDLCFTALSDGDYIVTMPSGRFFFGLEGEVTQYYLEKTGRYTVSLKAGDKLYIGYDLLAESGTLKIEKSTAAAAEIKSITVQDGIATVKYAVPGTSSYLSVDLYTEDGEYLYGYSTESDRGTCTLNLENYLVPGVPCYISARVWKWNSDMGCYTGAASEDYHFTYTGTARNTLSLGQTEPEHSGMYKFTPDETGYYTFKVDFSELGLYELQTEGDEYALCRLGDACNYGYESQNDTVYACLTAGTVYYVRIQANNPNSAVTAAMYTPTVEETKLISVTPKNTEDGIEVTVVYDKALSEEEDLTLMVSLEGGAAGRGFGQSQTLYGEVSEGTAVFRFTELYPGETMTVSASILQGTQWSEVDTMTGGQITCTRTLPVLTPGTAVSVQTGRIGSIYSLTPEETGLYRLTISAELLSEGNVEIFSSADGETQYVRGTGSSDTEKVTGIVSLKADVTYYVSVSFYGRSGKLLMEKFVPEVQKDRVISITTEETYDTLDMCVEYEAVYRENCSLCLDVYSITGEHLISDTEDVSGEGGTYVIGWLKTNILPGTECYIAASVANKTVKQDEVHGYTYKEYTTTVTKISDSFVWPDYAVASIALDEPVTVDDWDNCTYAFTAPEKGFYAVGITSGSLVVVDGNEIYLDSAYGNEGGTRAAELVLQAGQTVYLKAHFEYGTLTVQKAAAPKFVISTDKTTAVPGETVTVTVSLYNNPGLSCLDVALYEGGEGEELGRFTTAEAYTNSGVVLTKEFTIPGDAHNGEAIPFFLLFSADGNDPLFEELRCTDQTVVTVDAHKTGDIDGDGSVTLLDLVALMKSLAGMGEYARFGRDVDGNGRLGAADIICLMKLLAGEDV